MYRSAPLLPRGAGYPLSQAGRDEYLHHPLHHVYRKRIRGIRMRWLGSGVILGAIIGVILTLVASALVVTQFPPVAQYLAGEPDLSVVIGESYLNREAADRLKNGSIASSGNLALTGVKIDLKPDNRMDLQPTFNADIGIAKFDLNPAVKNNLTVQDGKLVISMLGDPQLGNLNLPLELLPFDLNGEVRKSVDKVNNDLLIAEINQALSSASAGTRSRSRGNHYRHEHDGQVGAALARALFHPFQVEHRYRHGERAFSGGYAIDFALQRREYFLFIGRVDHCAPAVEEAKPG